MKVYGYSMNTIGGSAYARAIRITKALFSQHITGILGLARARVISRFVQGANTILNKPTVAQRSRLKSLSSFDRNSKVATQHSIVGPNPILPLFTMKAARSRAETVPTGEGKMCLYLSLLVTIRLVFMSSIKLDDAKRNLFRGKMFNTTAQKACQFFVVQKNLADAFKILSLFAKLVRL